ncbi:MAG: hypothetical protein RLZZ297_1560 [Chloroflexota bacterium]
MEHSTQPRADLPVWYDENAHGRMRLSGSNARALLHRLSTNHIEHLPLDRALETVLTTPQGRSIDVLQVVHTATAVWVFTSAGQGPTVYTHLKKNIFFNDAVTLAPAANSHRQYALYGTGATAWLAAQTGLDLAAVAADGCLAWGETMLIRCTALAGDGWRILEPLARADGSPAALLPREQLTQLDAATLSRFQIEAGVPAFGSEISLEYVPLESGLEAIIHPAKGCYVGQEIIARMQARNRRAKNLERVMLERAVTTPAALTLADGTAVGLVTRVAATPHAGVIGFAFISTKVDTTGPLLCEGVPVTRWAGEPTPQEAS